VRPLRGMRSARTTTQPRREGAHAHQHNAPTQFTLDESPPSRNGRTAPLSISLKCPKAKRKGTHGETNTHTHTHTRKETRTPTVRHIVTTRESYATGESDTRHQQQSLVRIRLAVQEGTTKKKRRKKIEEHAQVAATCTNTYCWHHTPLTSTECSRWRRRGQHLRLDGHEPTRSHPHPHPTPRRSLRMPPALH